MKSIPKIIHYCWIGSSEKPKSVEYCIESWKKYCPDYEIIEWNESNYDFTKNQYMKEAYEAKKWGFATDYARLDIIYNYGGIYFDTDVEIIKSFDELLNQEAFIGFENTGGEKIFVNSGQGFGAKPKNKIIKQMLNYYENMKFRNNDGSLNTIPSPRYTTEILCNNGLKRENKKQILNDITVYKQDVLCPKNFTTGKVNITKDTYSIHHFTASWMDEKNKKYLEHKRNIYGKFGNVIGKYILIVEDLFKIYGLKLIIIAPIKLVKKIFKKNR